MSQSRQLIDALKGALRAGKKTYADVAVAWGLSEASVKRIFAEGNPSLDRLEAACTLAGIDIAELVEQMNRRRRCVTQLSREQEASIASDPVLMLVTVSVLNRLSFEQILERYALEGPQVIRCLTRLDRLRLIDLLPGNRFKLLTTENFHWIPNGPIQQLFLQRMKDDFFRSRFDREHEKLTLVQGMLSAGSIGRIKERMEELATEFVELNRADAAVPPAQREGVALVAALSNWRFELFAPFQRHAAARPAGD